MFKAYNSKNVMIFIEEICEIDFSKISSFLIDLASDSELKNVNLIVPSKTWGKHFFVFDEMFFKCEWNQYLYLRPFPLLPLSMRIFAYEECMRRGLSCPKLLGAFSVKEGKDWLWNGLIMEYLEGWRTLDRKDPGDIKLAEEAVDQMVKLGIHDDDFHQKNIMTDGNGNWKIVDLDQMRFYGINPEESRKQMMEKFLTLDI